MNLKISLLTIAAFTAISTTNVFAQNGEEIMKKNETQVLADDEQYEIVMTLTNNKGKSNVREIKQLTKRDKQKNRSSLILSSLGL